MRKRLSLLFLIVFLMCGTGCAAAPAAPTAIPTTEEVPMAIELTSPAFQHGQPIPRRHTCDGEDISPALNWRNIPPGTKSLALIMDDPDAPRGTWSHWVIFNIPPEVTGLPELRAGATAGLGLDGKNSWGRRGYGGPCPPQGTHRYFFRLYALDTLLRLQAGAVREEVLKAMEGHVLAQGELMGTYSRR